jgi:hypothetical protein
MNITNVNNIYKKETTITKANSKLEGNENKHHEQLKIKRRRQESPIDDKKETKTSVTSK